MITMMEVDRNGKRYWSATGKGPLRKIEAEGLTRNEARRAWHDVAMQQREEREVLVLSDHGFDHTEIPSWKALREERRE